MKRRLLACAIALSLVSVEARADGAIRGTIWSSRGEARRAELAREPAREAEPSSHGVFGFFGRRSPRKPTAVPATNAAGPQAPQPRNQPGITDAVVSLVQIPEPAERRLVQKSKRDRSRPNPRMLISGSRYRPRVMAVAAGTEVEFQNLDISFRQPYMENKIFSNTNRNMEV